MSILVEKDKRFLWHPFTQHGTEGAARVIASARGACLYDEDGREILDLISSWWTCAHGHAHPALNAALSDQAHLAEHVMFSGFTHAPAVLLAEKLAQILPGGLSKVFYSDNGSTAVEVALKMACHYWQNKGQGRRTRFLAFEGGYHGDTAAAMAVGRGSGFFRAYDGLMFSVDLLPFPATWEGDAEAEHKERQALSTLSSYLDAHGDDVAALILEPVMQGAGGMRVCRPSFVREVRERAGRSGALVIFDEVATGFGRLGTLFASQLADTAPDIICLSKAMTSGYMPLSATVTRPDIFDAFLGEDFSRALAHGHSFTANPLACAVALRSLALFEEERTLEKIKEIERQHRAFLPRLCAHPLAVRPRVAGTLLAFSLAGAGAGYKSSAGEFLRGWFLENGFNIRPLNDTVYLLPPYCITGEQLAQAYDGIMSGLSALEAHLYGHKRYAT